MLTDWFWCDRKVSVNPREILDAIFASFSSVRKLHFGFHPARLLYSQNSSPKPAFFR
ncbi:MAG: hypothetical protein J0L70_23645 [Leptolyngbya sp. UWPOB_LEPTO1]|uniref:hypothetical protein n=1 Tax=Leptolyngbya sp. UWPOB_LEPTO1 TaxID=2815653 RepID=UPI001AC526F6|nr:hypothetical protein [Leptolyngbya sp. UWPOB_LEPTO1]MBN8563537.1 hypothetical protein [Leptolyngbya sp. UWPOB_LEPTO1]